MDFKLFINHYLSIAVCSHRYIIIPNESKNRQIRVLFVIFTDFYIILQMRKFRNRKLKNAVPSHIVHKHQY